MSSFTHSQVVLNLNEFLSSVKHKGYFEECGKPNSYWSPVKKKMFSYYQSQWRPATVTHILQNIFFCVQHRNKNEYRFGTTWQWVNNDRIRIFGWTIPLMTSCSMFSSVPLRPARICFSLNRYFHFRHNQSRRQDTRPGGLVWFSGGLRGGGCYFLYKTRRQILIEWIIIVAFLTHHI